MNLLLDRFCAGYGSVTIVNDVHLEVPAGTVLAVLGRNGMGKSTLLKGILGYLSGTSGSVRFDGVESARSRTSDIVRRGVGYAPQEEAIFAALTVAENLEAGALFGRSDPTRLREVLSFFPILGERPRQRAGTLSGGEQRMLALARVLLASPRLIVLDEISAGLQPARIAEAARALRCEKQRGTTIVMVEQNIDFALELADRMAVMKLGRIILEDSARSPGIRAEIIRELAP